MVGCLDHNGETLDLSDDKLCLCDFEAVDEFSHGVCRIASICTSASCNDTQEKDGPVDLLVSHATLAHPVIVMRGWIYGLDTDIVRGVDTHTIPIL